MCLKDEDKLRLPVCAEFSMLPQIPLRISKLAAKVDYLIERCTYDHDIIRCIDRYYYIQKSVELKMIHDAFVDERLSSQIVIPIYTEVFARWRQDSRWLNHHILFNIPCHQTFSSFALGQS